MWQAFFQDRKFLRVALAVSLISPLLGQLAVFPSVFAFRELGFEAQMAAWLGMAAAGSRLALSPAAGWLTDAWGARPALLLWASLTGLGFLLLVIVPATASVFVVVGIAAVAGSGFAGAMNALTSGIPRPEHRAGHFTLLGFCMIGANSGGPLLAGWIFDAFSYRTGFAVLAAASVAVIAISYVLLRDLSPHPEDYS
jgi:MFS family permease